jgi:hypothetical protein
LGFGGGALAVRHEGTAGNETLRIWFGTIVDPTKRPATYHQDDCSLDHDEVATGAVHMLTWQPGNNSVQVQASLPPYYPTGGNRGAYGVVGLKLGNAIVEPVGTPQRDELVVTTMSGDVIVYAILPGPPVAMQEIWRTHVMGAIGFYNSIAIEDLDGDGLNELYIAGSLGLWRFTQPGE